MANCVENQITYDSYNSTYTGGYAQGNNPQGIVTNVYGKTANFGYYDWDYKEVNGVVNSTLDPLFKAKGKKFNVDWRLIAAWCFNESTFKINAKSDKTTAAGIWQFTNAAWQDYAPKGYKDDPNYTYRFQPNISMEAFDALFSRNLKRFNNAASKKDQIALAIQAHHDGIISGTSWKNMKGNDNSKNRYLGVILDKYYSYLR